jgi:hypothetical protein
MGADKNSFSKELGLYLLTPKFGKESDLWVQHGEESVRKKEGFFRRIRQKSPRSAICFRRQENCCADFAGLRGDVARAEGTNGWISDRI